MLLLVAGWKIFHVVASYAVSPILPLIPAFTAIRDPRFWQFGKDIPYGLWVWGNLDGFYYMHIALAGGYLNGQQPFFPLFPIAMRIIHRATGLPLVLAGQLVSLTAFILAIIVIRKLLAFDGFSKYFSTIFVSLLLFPTSFYYGSVYNDALFFLLATLTLYWGRKEHWLAAGVVGALATLTRLNGLALFWYLMVESRSLRKSFFLIPAAFTGYLAYIQVKFGTWRALFDAMKVWGQDEPVFPLQTVWRYVKIFLSVDPKEITYWVAVGEIGFLMFLVALLVWSFKKIRLSYWVFFAVSVLIPATTGTFQGMPRYGLHLFPMYLVLALFLAQKPVITKIVAATVAIGLQLVYLTMFTRGWFAT